MFDAMNGDGVQHNEMVEFDSLGNIDTTGRRVFVDKNLDINVHKIKDHKLDDDD